MKQKHLPRLGLIIIGLILGLILVELFIRGVVFIYQFRQNRAIEASIKQKHSITILALGESTTQAGEEKSWPAQLEEILNKQNLGYTFSVINQGKFGTTTTKILKELNTNLNKYHPQIVISMMGINDSRDSIHILRQSNPLEKLFLVRLIEYVLANYQTSSSLQNNAEVADAESANLQSEDIKSQEFMLKKISTYLIGDHFNELYDTAKQALVMWPEKKAEYSVFLDLADAYRQVPPDYKSAQKAFDQALKVDIKPLIIPNIYERLGKLHYRTYHNIQKSLPFFQKAAQPFFQKAANQTELVKNSELLSSYSLYLASAGEYSQADEAAEKVLMLPILHGYDLYALQSLYKSEGQRQKENLTKVNEMISVQNPLTDKNYQNLQKILQQKGIGLIAVQYPMLSVRLLKDVLGKDGFYVDNEASFRQAIAKDGYDKYFADRFGGDFGHATKYGNFLLASNIAKVVEEYLKSQYIDN